jgi:uncharacterized membrane protein (UPF0127 family)/CheY-like chemotaxis protein
MTGAASIIVNLSRETVVCERTAIASTPWRRMRGLLGRASLTSGEGMLLCPAPSIHTAFMRFPIDVVFLDQNLRVVKIDAELAPWRMASARHARAVLELPAGEAQRRELVVGDQLGVIAVGDRPSPVRTLADGLDAGSEPDGRPEALRELDARGLAASTPAETVPGAPRVLLASSDRRFRSVAATLLVRRGCGVIVAERDGDLVELAERERADVVLIDAGARMIPAARDAASIREECPALGVVVVADDGGQHLSSATVLAKWDAFTQLFDAIEAARPLRLSESSADAGQ